MEIDHGYLRRTCPVLIIGAGLAGCICALNIAKLGVPVVLLSASDNLENANSWLAQGGIIYKSKDPDDANMLKKDIFNAGHDHNYALAVEYLVKHGPKAVADLLIDTFKVPFDKDETGNWDLTREGGHSSYRILHCADHTGKSIMEVLLEFVKKEPNIELLEGYSAIDLLTSHHHTKGMTYRYQLENECCGAYVLQESTNTVITMLADVTVLATGGIGQVYLHTTNSSTATGSGIAMASRAFVRMENLEFVQFHPTAFYHIDSRRFLITEALRGEGAKLITSRGDSFMDKYDSRAELAPRDIVAKSIMNELLISGEPCVYLDATNVKHDVKQRFPTVFYDCAERGIDIRTQPIPVVPAAHYFCGGIVTDSNGRTSLHRLYSIGECSCTGIHGANRLASTSLLEAVLWGDSAAKDIVARITELSKGNKELNDMVKDWCITGDEHNDDPALIAQDWMSIRSTMWNYVGISRTTARLERAFEKLRDLSRQIHDFYRTTPLSKPTLDLFHGCQTAYLITQAALRNSQAIGCHYLQK